MPRVLNSNLVAVIDLAASGAGGGAAEGGWDWWCEPLRAGGDGQTAWNLGRPAGVRLQKAPTFKSETAETAEQYLCSDSMCLLMRNIIIIQSLPVSHRLFELLRRYNFRGEGGEPGDVYVGDSENHVVVKLRRAGLNVLRR